MRRSIAVAAAILLMACAPSCTGEEQQEEAGEPAPAPAERADPPGRDRPVNVSHVVLRAPDGETRKIEDYSGRILMVHFFATWHEDTARLVEWMNAIQRRFGSNVDVLMIAMDREGRRALRTFLAENEVEFDVYGNGGEIASEFGGVRTLPTTYILLRDGTILHRYDGIQRRKVYEDFILAMKRRRL